MVKIKNDAIFERLRKRILSLYEEYHRPEYLSMDPLAVVRKLSAREDREMGGFIASLLSYGRVETINRNVETLFDLMNRRPAEFIFTTDLGAKRRMLAGFRHRFNDGDDIALLLQTIASLSEKTGGSMEPLLRDALDDAGDEMCGALGRFCDKIRRKAAELSTEVKESFFFLLPSPALGSACKRLNMFLRWMVRPDDGIDLGLWKSVPTELLIMPVDTHVANISRRAGITSRRSADWRMAEEITAFLRRIDPLDPVKFDFSICRLGMRNSRKENP